MLTLKDILDNIELQSKAKYCYYDYEKEVLVELSEEEAGQCEVRYLYEADGCICFEINKD